MATTTWVLCDHAGQPVTEISNAAERRFVARRNQGRQAQITMSHDDAEAIRLLDLTGNGVPQLRYYRDGTLRLSAYLTSIDGQLSEDGQDQLTAIFKDPFGRMLGDGSETGRHLFAAVEFTAQDQGSIGWDLIDALNDDSDTGIREGTIETTTTRDRSYEAGKNVGEALVQLTEVIGGFDFEILPLDPTDEDGKLGEYTVYAEQGEDRDDLLWGFGKSTMANVQAVARTITQPVNRVRMVTGEGLVADEQDAASLAKFGRWSRALSAPTDVVVQATLDQQAEDRLRPTWVKVTAFTPDPTIGPQPFDDYWIGDTGRFRGMQGAFNEAFVPRVEAVTIIENADGSETHELEVSET